MAISDSNSAITITDTPDEHGGIIRRITAVSLAGDTVRADVLMAGYTAHDSSGQPVVGTATGGGGQTINNQNKAVTPTESQQIVQADGGYTGLGTVTVGAINSSFVGSGVARRSSADLSMQGDTIIVPPGYYASQAKKELSHGTHKSSGGCPSFIFNDIPCDEFDLMMYDIDGVSRNSSSFASGVTILEDKTAYRYRPFFYGTRMEDKLKFQLVFGINEERLESGQFLSRDELDTIATWLTGHNKYLWLYINQDDLKQIRYKCIITKLEIIDFGMIPYALRASVECDSPYGYLPPQTFEYNIENSLTIRFFNDSSHNGFYKPKLEILPTTRNFKIRNATDGNRELAMANLPTSIKKINIDNELEIVSFDDENINPYAYFNFNYLRLLHGGNNLVVTGSGKLKITCEFPVNTGS